MMRSVSFRGLRVPDTRASQRRSLAGRMSQRVASGLSFADGSHEEMRTGTVTGMTINTLCSIIGAGVLSLPLALYYSSVVVGLALLFTMSMFAAFSVYLLVVGCDATNRYSLTEVVAFALFPPQLWEEYLYRKATEKSLAPSRGSSQQHVAGSSSRSGRGAAPAVGDERALRDATAYESVTSSTAADGPNAKRRHRSVSHRHCQQQQQHEGMSAAPPLPEEEDVGHSHPTSAYAGMRDEYARQEWHNRRRRRIATVVMELIIFCSNYGTLVIFSKVIADSMPPVVGYITNTDGLFVTKEFWLASGGIVFFVLSCARNMEELKWSSLLGFLTIFYVVLIILYRYHTQRVRDYPHVSPEKYGAVNWMHLSVKMLQTVSTFGLAFAYHYNVPYMYKELQDRRPERMMESLVVAFPIIIACYALTGVFGYLTFGKEVANKRVGGNIVSNYPQNDLPMNVGRLGLFAHFACVFPVVSICTRRGLHRLTMIALTWSEQSRLMRDAAIAAGAILTQEEEESDSESDDFITSPRQSDGDGRVRGESSPLLHAGSPPPPPSDYDNFNGGAPPQQQPINFHASTAPRTATAATHGHSYQSLSDANTEDNEHGRFAFNGARHDTVDVDRDVGSPDLTTTLAIVIEAAFLVLTSVFIAGTVSGIDFVINIIGTLFSVFLVMVAPGIVGWCVFSPTGPFGSAAAAAAAHATQLHENEPVGGTARSSEVGVNGASSRYRFIRIKLAMCLVTAVLGISITCIGISVLVYDAIKGIHRPAL